MSLQAVHNSKSARAQPFIQAAIQVGGQWREFRAILDSGNDITLITQQTAAQLGLSPRMASGSFKVQFGHQQNEGHNFYMVKVPMRLGPHLRPFMASVGVGPARENLIGRQDAFEHHSITFTGGQISITQSNPNNNTFTVGLGNNRAMHAQYNAQSRYRDVLTNNYI